MSNLDFLDLPLAEFNLYCNLEFHECIPEMTFQYSWDNNSKEFIRGLI